jgi:hypothetical protein
LGGKGGAFSFSFLPSARQKKQKKKKTNKTKIKPLFKKW